MALANYEQQRVDLKRIEVIAQELRQCRRILLKDFDQLQSSWAINVDSALVLDRLSQFLHLQMGMLVENIEKFCSSASVILEEMNGLNKITGVALVTTYPQLPERILSLERPLIRIDTGRLTEVKNSLFKSIGVIADSQRQIRSAGGRIDPMILQQQDLQAKINKIHSDLDKAYDTLKRIIYAIEQAVSRYETAEKRIREKAEAIKTLDGQGYKWPTVDPRVIHPPIKPPLIRIEEILKSSFEDGSD